MTEGRMPRPKKSSYANEKPPLSYVALCAMAIRSSSAGMMSLNEIYRYIVNKFPYYKNTCSKWRNSLRHNLSFNDCFVKIIHGSESGNKRSLWSLHPNCGDMFEDGSLLRRKRRFMTNRRRHKEDDSTPFKIRPASKLDQSTLVAGIGQNGDVHDKIPMLRGLLHISNIHHKEYKIDQRGLSPTNKKQNESLTNFTIENILRSSFPSSKKTEIETNQRYSEKDSYFLQNKSHFDSSQNFERIFRSNNCDFTTHQQTGLPYGPFIGRPAREFCCHHDYPAFSQYARSFSCKQCVVKSSRESLTLHYKAGWF